PLVVIAGLDPAIQAGDCKFGLVQAGCTQGRGFPWIAGSSPAMTLKWFHLTGIRFSAAMANEIHCSPPGRSSEFAMALSITLGKTLWTSRHGPRKVNQHPQHPCLSTFVVVPFTIPHLQCDQFFRRGNPCYRSCWLG